MSKWGRLSATPFVDTKAVFERDQTLLLIFSFLKNAVVHNSLNYKKDFFPFFLLVKI